jgi:hypothetical protein
MSVAARHCFPTESARLTSEMNNSDITFILTAVGACTGVLGLILAIVAIALAATTTTTLIVISSIAGWAFGLAIGLWIAKRLRTPP